MPAVTFGGVLVGATVLLFSRALWEALHALRIYAWWLFSGAARHRAS